jgi:hypothetical protein
MNNGLSYPSQFRKIDSIQKLNFLLFLQQQPDIQKTSQEFAERLYIGDTGLLNRIITDLQLAGLIEQAGNRYRLRNQPQVRAYLNALAKIFEDPLARQGLLDQIRRQPQPEAAIM